MFKMSLTAQIICGILLGIICGIFFGEASQVLEPLGQAFIMLLQMPVLIYLFCSIVIGINKLSLKNARGVLAYSLIYLIASIGITKISIFWIPKGFPSIKVVSQFAEKDMPAPSATNFLEFFIPANPFQAFAEGTVPAIVVFSIFLAVALIRTRNKQSVIENLATFQEASATIIAWITRLSPIGVFALTAPMAGIRTLAYFQEVQYYYYADFFVSVVVSVIIIPLLVSAFLPLNFRAMIGPLRPALLLAFITGNVLVTLPIVIAALEKEANKQGFEQQKSGGFISTLVPLLFNFPVAGKMVTLIFIYFASWHYNQEISGLRALRLSALGLLTSFGTLSQNIKFLVESFELPLDSMDMFFSSWVLSSRFAAVSTVASIATFCLFTTSSFEDRLTFHWKRLVVGLSVAFFSFGAWFYLMKEFSKPIFEKNAEQALLTIEQPISFSIVDKSHLAKHLRKNPGAFNEISLSQTLRVGFMPNDMPFAYENAHHELVGLDVELAHSLARDLGLKLIFVPLDSENEGAILLNQGVVDLVMAGLTLSVDLIKQVSTTAPYLFGHQALVMKDHLKKNLSTVEAINTMPGATIATTPELLSIAERIFPEKQMVVVKTADEFAEQSKADILFWRNPRALVWSSLHPFYSFISDDPALVDENIVFALPKNAVELLNYLNKWIELKRAQGDIIRGYDKWVLNKKSEPKKRWSILDNIILPWLYDRNLTTK